MLLTVPTQATDQRRHVEALAALLSHADLSDICTWTLNADDGIQGQLQSGYDDHQAYDRIHALAHHLTDARLSVHRLHTEPAITAVEAHGTTSGVPVRFWTHIRNQAVVEGADVR